MRKSTTFRETRYPSLDLANCFFWHFLDSIERFLGNKENQKAKILILLLSFALTTVGPPNLFRRNGTQEETFYYYIILASDSI